jgi:guanosine-3',5'-bis(diphosphate) 3'-pyrophosphohydrolase
MDIVEKARVFAMAAHASVKQLRKYTNEPYWVHPQEVAKMVSELPNASKAMVAAAHLHDVVEDTGVTIEIIESEFGEEVATMVRWLTDVSKPEDGPRWYRKKLDREHTAQAPAEVQSIKLADLISNSRSIMTYDPKFAKVYLEEKRMLLEVLTRGDAGLRAKAAEFVIDCV